MARRKAGSNPADIKLILQQLEFMRSQFGATVLLVQESGGADHAVTDQTQALSAAVDATFHLTLNRIGGVMTLSKTQAKESYDSFEPMDLQLGPVKMKTAQKSRGRTDAHAVTQTGLGSWFIGQGNDAWLPALSQRGISMTNLGMTHH